MLDQTVERNKNLRDAHIVENWIRKSHDILEKCELDPLPDSFLHETVPSETGTDYSAAMTSEHVQHDQQSAKAEDQISPPESPPWRLKNEGGVPGDMPSLALHEFHEALAAFQDQAREHALQRAKQEEQHKMKEAQRRPSEGARQPQTKQEQLKKASQEQASKHAVETTQDSSKPGNLAATRETTRERKEVRQVTLGLSLGNSEHGGMKVVRIKDAGCVALHGGIQVGDHVLTIDGNDVSEKTAIQLNKLVCGPEGSQAVLEVVKAAATEAVTITIKRELAAPGPARFGVVQRDQDR